MVRTLNPLLYSTSKSSTSFNITAKACLLYTSGKNGIIKVVGSDYIAGIGEKAKIIRMIGV